MAEELRQLKQLDLSLFNCDTKELVQAWRANTLDNRTSKLDFQRDNYQFIELCIIFAFLDGKGKISLKRLGALHKTRWMAKVLYAIKICLLEFIIELPPGIIATRQQLAKVKDFLLFMALIYGSWWYSCHSTGDAPWNELKLYKNLLMYNAVNHYSSC